MYQKGFVPIIYIIAIVVISGGILGGFLYLKNNTSKIDSPSPSPASIGLTPSPKITTSPLPSATPSYKPAKKALPAAPISPTPTKISPSPAPTASSAPKITCTINTSVSSGWSPVGVYFSYSASDQSRVTGTEWDLDGDGKWESETSTPNWIYKDVNSYEAKLRLKLSDGSYSETCSKTITVNPPSITCSINASVVSGPAPLAVNFIYSASFYGTNDYVTDVQWDFNGDGTWDTPYDYSSQNPPAYTFSNPGNYTAKMHLKTHNGVETDICTKSITVN